MSEDYRRIERALHGYSSRAMGRAAEVGRDLLPKSKDVATGLAGTGHAFLRGLKGK